MQGIRRHIHISTENINHFEESRQLTIFLFIIGDQQCNVASSFSVTIERIKNNFLDALPSLDFMLSLLGRVTLPNRMNFRKSSKGGGSFSIQKSILQVWDLYTGLQIGIFGK